MKKDERDKLLLGMARDMGGFKESLYNIYHLTEKQEQHLEKLNGTLEEHSKRLAETEGEVRRVDLKVDERTVPKHKRSKKIITGYSGIVLVVMTLVYYLGQARGWW